jgi:hypothetical protein
MTMKEVAQREGKTLTTVHRWLNVGVTIRGKRIRLQAARSGWTWDITQDDLSRFKRELTEASTAPLAGAVA